MPNANRRRYRKVVALDYSIDQLKELLRIAVDERTWLTDRVDQLAAEIVRLEQARCVFVDHGSPTYPELEWNVA